MSEETKPIQVDLALAVQQLQANPELGPMINELVGGLMGRELSKAQIVIQVVYDLIQEAVKDQLDDGMYINEDFARKILDILEDYAKSPIS